MPEELIIKALGERSTSSIVKFKTKSLTKIYRISR